jgi:hypothetical protein
MATKKANNVIDDDVDDDQLKSKPSPSDDGQVNKQAAADLEKVPYQMQNFDIDVIIYR